MTAGDDELLGMALEFDDDDVAVGELSFDGPVKSLVDDLTPVFGQRLISGRWLAKDYRVRELRITRGQAPGVGGVTIDRLAADSQISRDRCDRSSGCDQVQDPPPELRLTEGAWRRPNASGHPGQLLVRMRIGLSAPLRVPALASRQGVTSQVTRKMQVMSRIEFLYPSGPSSGWSDRLGREGPCPPERAGWPREDRR
jgi:hypothetical protein